MARNHNFGLGAIKFLSVSSVLSVVKREVQPFTTDGTEATEDEPGSKLFLRRLRGVYLQPATTKAIPTIVKLRYNL